MPYYLIDYPMFGKKTIGQMGISIPGTKESDMGDEQSISKRCHLYTYEVEISDQPTSLHVHAYNMNHALRVASNIHIFNDETVTVRLEK